MILTMIPEPSCSEFTCHCALFIKEDSAELTAAFSGSLNEIDFSGSKSDELWLGTCAELFIRTPGESGYTEINCSPDGRSAVYHFDSYRSGKSVGEGDIVPVIQMEKRENRVRLKILFPGTALEGKECAVGVITADHEGNRRFWGVDHWEGKPDFHREENFFLIES